MSAPDEAEELKRLHVATTNDGRVHLPTLGPDPKPSGSAVADAQAGTRASEGPRPDAAPIEPALLEAQVVEILKTIYDPEIPVNIYELGLIYGITIQPGPRVEVEMTLTAPACPVAGWLVEEVGRRVLSLEAVVDAHVELVWDPPWTKDRMSEEAQLELGLI